MTVWNTNEQMQPALNSSNAHCPKVTRKALASKVYNLATALVDPDPQDLLSRFRRGRRPFAGNVEEKIMLRSQKGLTEAKTTMKYLKSDTFFSRFPIPLLPSNTCLGANHCDSCPHYSPLIIKCKNVTRIPLRSLTDYAAIFQNDDSAGDRDEEVPELKLNFNFISPNFNSVS